MADAKFDPKALEKLQAEAAKRSEEARKAADAAKAAEEQAKAMVAEAAKPFSDRHAHLTEQRNKLTAQYKEKLATIDSAVKENMDKAKDAGIPAVFVGKQTTRAPRSTGGNKGGNGTRSNLNLSELGAVGPVEVEAIKRTGNGVQTMKVTYLVEEEDGKMVAQGQYGETVKRGNLSIAASQAGWHNAHDVAYALIVAAGKMDEFPNIHPSNPTSTITVNGSPAPYRISESEQGEAKTEDKQVEEAAV